MVARSTVRSTIRPTLRTIGNSSPIGSGGGVWLLEGGTWNDEGVWDDSAVWPATFDVSTLDGLCAWFDFSDNTTVLNAISPDTPATNGQAVRRILDKSGNAKHANQGTGLNQGLFVTGAANGRGVLRLDGTNDFYECGAIGDWNFLHNGTASLVVAVVKFGTSSDPNAGYTLLDTTAATNASIGFFWLYDDRASVPRNNAIVASVTRGVFGSGNEAAFTLNQNVVIPNQYTIIETAIDADAASAGNRIRSIVDGGAEFGSNTSTKAPSASNSTFTLNLGRLASGALYFAGDLCELIICNQANADKRADLRAALAYKWGVTLA